MIFLFNLLQLLCLPSLYAFPYKREFLMNSIKGVNMSSQKQKIHGNNESKRNEYILDVTNTRLY